MKLVGTYEQRSAKPQRLMALEIGSRLGHYDVTAKIGEGGMGEVYRARDTKLDWDVALKVLPALNKTTGAASSA